MAKQVLVRGYRARFRGCEYHAPDDQVGRVAEERLPNSVSRYQGSREFKAVSVVLQHPRGICRP